MNQRDQRYAQLQSDIEAFEFDASVTAVFADMIRRSVPGYSAVVAMTGVIAGEHATEGSHIYDIGCSLGTGLLAVSDYAPESCTLIGVDNSADMIAEAQQHLDKIAHPIQLHCQDAQQANISNASLVIMNYTLQFIAPSKRLALLKHIYAGLNPGGVLLLSEKVNFSDDTTEHNMMALYHAFKRQNGYSQLEISQKRSALENVLITDTTEQHLERLQQAGFKQADVWFQCLNFKSFVAIKT